MNVYAPIILCFVPFITMFLLFGILVPGISVLREFLASLAGLMAVVPIVLLQFLIPELRLFHQVKIISILLYALIFCGLVEEVFKAASLLIVKAKGETLRNFFLYSLLAGMIFGCFETVVYLVQSLQEHLNTGINLPVPKLIYLRMVTALVVHTLCSGLGGLCVFYCKNIRRNFAPLVYAVLLHGVYDFFFLVSYETLLNYFSIAAILLAALECRIIYVRAREEISSMRFSGQKISDPNKTLEMPKNPALVISVKNTIKQKEENDMFFSRKKNNETVDFDAIQREAEAAVKKGEEKKNVAEKKASEKTAVMKTVVKKAATKSKATEKTVVKKSASAKKKAATAKKSVAKKATAAKKTAAKKVGTTKKPVAKKVTSKKNTTAKKLAAKKPVAKKTAAKKPAAKKTSIAVKKPVNKKK